MKSTKTSIYLLFLLSALAFAAFGIIWWGVSQNADWIHALDNWGIQLIRSNITETATSFFHTVTFFGGTVFLTLASILVFVIFLWKKGWSIALWFGGTALLGELVIPQVVKHIVMRPRPENPLINVSGYSFPSGHSAGSTTFYGILVIILCLIIFKKAAWKWLSAVIACLWILTIMVSRVYLGVHYPSDVLAGCLVGIGSISLTTAIYLRTQTKKLPFM
ncbi:phosphatase PAP2 family protein [Listeria costaricensis]|uniref:phosphatase PAP2 family protein n=1 Tax=Listeria costaricensis TaxID=2026604 RepID=UPI000C071CEA|nr:phosphatase PAP2 family protein [Listeria costaricensis]